MLFWQACILDMSDVGEMVDVLVWHCVGVGSHQHRSEGIQAGLGVTSVLVFFIHARNRVHRSGS